VREVRVKEVKVGSRREEGVKKGVEKRE